MHLTKEEQARLNRIYQKAYRRSQTFTNPDIKLLAKIIAVVEQESAEHERQNSGH